MAHTITLDADQIAVGDVIVIYSTLANFIGKPELAGTASTVTAVKVYSEDPQTTIGITTAATGECYAGPHTDITVQRPSWSR